MPPPLVILGGAIGLAAVLGALLWLGVDPEVGTLPKRPASQIGLLANGSPVPETRAPAGVPLQVRLSCLEGCKARVYFGHGSTPAEPLDAGPWSLRPGAPPRVLDIGLVLGPEPRDEWLEVELCPPHHPGRCRRIPYRLR